MTKQPNFRQLDLNLLRVLCAVYRLGSVTQAAQQLSLSQPATSNALARLRSYFDDALFVRSPHGLHPTRKAQRIVPGLIAQLATLESAITAPEGFEPVHSAMHWRLSTSDLGEMMFLPRFAQALRAQSPRSQVSNVAVDASRVPSALEAHEIDLAIGILAPGPDSIASELLFQERFVGITAENWHPPVGRARARLSARQLSATALAVAAPAATFHGSVEGMLAKLKLTDNTVVRARHYGALPDLVTRSDLMAIVPQMYANSLSPRYPIRIWELADHGPHYSVRMLWHQTATQDLAHSWLRKVIRELFSRTGDAKPAPSPQQ
ncbi:MAG: LysR family transcriptional regulator [Rhodoferax sp.]